MRILLLDEPLSNLDARVRESMRFELREIQQRSGITALFVTHDIQEAFVLSDRVAVMCRGRIEQVRISAVVTAVSLVVGYPAACFRWTLPPMARALMILAYLSPSLVSVVVKAYGSTVLVALSFGLSSCSSAWSVCVVRSTRDTRPPEAAEMYNLILYLTVMPLYGQM